MNRRYRNVETFHFSYLCGPEADKVQNLINSSLLTDTSAGRKSNRQTDRQRASRKVLGRCKNLCDYYCMSMSQISLIDEQYLCVCEGVFVHCFLTWQRCILSVCKNDIS